MSASQEQRSRDLLELVESVSWVVHDYLDYAVENFKLPLDVHKSIPYRSCWHAPPVGTGVVALPSS